MKQANFDKETKQLTVFTSKLLIKDIRLAIIQFKTIHHILPTNATLFWDSLFQQKEFHLCTRNKPGNTFSQFVPLYRVFGLNLTSGGRGKTQIQPLLLSKQE